MTSTTTSRKPANSTKAPAPSTTPASTPAPSTTPAPNPFDQVRSAADAYLASGAVADLAKVNLAALAIGRDDRGTMAGVILAGVAVPPKGADAAQHGQRVADLAPVLTNPSKPQVNPAQVAADRLAALDLAKAAVLAALADDGQRRDAVAFATSADTAPIWQASLSALSAVQKIGKGGKSSTASGQPRTRTDKPAPALSDGQVLTGRYKGQVFTATVTTASPLAISTSDGQVFTSLTAAAKHLTGQASVNGAKAFGLRD